MRRKEKKVTRGKPVLLYRFSDYIDQLLRSGLIFSVYQITCDNIMALKDLPCEKHETCNQNPCGERVKYLMAISAGSPQITT